MIRSLKKPWHGIGPRLACRRPRPGVSPATDGRLPLHRMTTRVIRDRSHGIRLSSPSMTFSSGPCPQTSAEIAANSATRKPPTGEPIQVKTLKKIGLKPVKELKEVI